jgi:HEAT repeat protein
VAAALLGDQGDGVALPALADALSDPTQPQAVLTETRSALLRLSSQIDPGAEARRFESDDPQERMRAVMLLAIKGGPAGQDLAMRALKDSNLRVQAAGASAAADLGVVQALPRIKALSDKEEEAPILRVLQISARRLERKQQSPAGDSP